MNRWSFVPVLTEERVDRRVQEAAPARRGIADLVPSGLTQRPSRQQLLLVVLLLAVVAFAVTRMFGAGGGADPLDEPVAADPAAPSDAGVPAATASVNEDDIAFDATVEELKRFVAAQRELEFQRPVQIVQLDDEAFAARFAKMYPTDGIVVGQVRQVERVLKAFGLVTPGYDLVEEVTDPASHTQGLLGWYDPKSESLYVRGGSLTPMIRSVLVHELVHALDDQHFDIEALVGREGDLEESIAARALVEGNAMRIQHEYEATLSAADRAAVESETDDKVTADGLSAESFQPVSYFGAFPYLDGERFVSELAEVRGEDAVDDIFRRPPDTTAEVLEPQRYQLGLSGHRLAAPSSPTEPIDSGMFGELGLLLLLAEAVGPAQAAIAAAPWEADSYVAYEDGDRMCVRLHVLLESPWSSALTAQILEGWADQQIDASVSDLGVVEATSCR